MLFARTCSGTTESCEVHGIKVSKIEYTSQAPVGIRTGGIGIISKTSLIKTGILALIMTRVPNL
jgi:hypothetical protein